MAAELRVRLYIVGVIAGGGLTVGFAAWLWPVLREPWQALWALGIAGLVFLAGRYPFKLSPQAQAVAVTAPLFMGILILPPVSAALAGLLGLLASEATLRRPPRVLLFNVGATVLTVALAAMAYWALLPGGPMQALRTVSAIPGVVAGAVVFHVTNLALMGGMVTIHKGVSFWRRWRQTWVTDVLQEGGLLVLGYLAALLVAEVWWGAPLLTVPAVLVYVGFRRSVEETVKNARLAEDNARLAAEVERRLRELQETQSQLIQSAKMASVGVLAAGVAHEINNPIFAIEGRAELLLRSPERHLKSERAVEYLKSIHQMARRVSTIVKEVLEYSRPKGSVEPVKVSAAMDVALDLVGKFATNKGIEIQRQYDDIPVVQAVPNMLQQVFVNLLLNAIDATPHGGRITLRCASGQECVIGSIKDTGVGIPEAVMPHLFEPFFTTKEAGKGMGLGLFLCHRIVTEHGGRIHVESQEGVGTEVVMELPASRRPEAVVASSQPLEGGPAEGWWRGGLS